jgi:hypothetical protein
MMKVLDYEKGYGTQDRDHTMLVAKLVPYHSDGPIGDHMVNQANGEYFKAKEFILAQVARTPGALSAEEGRQVTESLTV